MHKPCKQCGKDIPNPHSVALKHRIYCSRECQGLARRGKTLSAEWRQALSDGRKASEKCKGPNLYNWKGGASTVNERMREHRHKRQSALSLPLDRLFLKALRAAQGDRCFYCETVLDKYAAVEHLTPLSRGGDNQIFNTVWACLSCNSSKRSNTLEEWIIKTGNFYWGDKWDVVFSTALVISKRYA